MSYFKRITPTLNLELCYSQCLSQYGVPNQSSLSRMGWTIRYISKNLKNKEQEKKYLRELKIQLNQRKPVGFELIDKLK